MDRDELDARIRSRRVDQPYRRGGYAEEWDDDAAPGYRPFEPEPEDELARHAEADAASAPQHVDNMADEVPPAVQAEGHEPEPAAPAAPPLGPEAREAPAPYRRGREVEDAPEASVAPEPAPAAPPPAAVTAAPDPWASRSVEPPPPAVEDPEYATYDEEGWPADEPYYVPADDDDGRRGGAAAPIIGFVALGVVALLLGVFFSNVFGGNGVAQGSASPTASATDVATETAVPTPDVTSSAAPSSSGSANASEGPPIEFPDGFTATTEPCLTQPNQRGCASDGTTNSGRMWVYIGFQKGRSSDVVGMTIVDSADAVVAQASIELSQVNCPVDVPCNGWLLFPGFGTPYTGLAAGDYRIRINRNGLPAAEADFTVS